VSVFAESCTLPGGCGVGVYAYFQDSPDSWEEKMDISLAPHSGGAGYLITHFVVGDKLCDEAYKILKDRFPIVFESDKRKNKNSDNKVYFCVYDTKGKCESGFDAVEEYTNDEY
jgi:hypothetical protein